MLKEKLGIFENIKIEVINHYYGSFENTANTDELYKIVYITEHYYKEIIKMTDDVLKISKNLKIDSSIIEKIKNHIFNDEHILNQGEIYYYGKFKPNYDIALAWFRLLNNNFVQSDIILLQHELLELHIMDGKKLTIKLRMAL